MSYLALIGLLLAAPPVLPARYMPLEAIRPGMKGVGKTVLKGTEIVEFNVEVIGVLRNVAPKRNMILIRLSGQGLERTGVISGMSGSPIYIEGRLAGALAYGWSFTKAPIAGVTPIGEMLEVGKGLGPGGGAVSEGGGLGGAGSVHRLAVPLDIGGRSIDRVRVLFRPGPPPRRDDLPVLAPLITPVVVSGAGSGTLARLRPMLERIGFLPVRAGKLPAAARGLRARLEPGAVCAVSLVTGDLDLTAIGTVTERVGDTILAFGHPFFGEGKVEMPLSTGAVLAVMPSQRFSFKFGVALEPVGAIVADEAAGIRGVVGRRAKTIPITINLTRSADSKQYHFNLVRHREYTPSLLGEVMYETLFSRGGLPRRGCRVRMEAKLTFGNHSPLRLRNTYPGQDGAFWAIRRVMQAADEIINNDIQPISLERAELDLTVEPGFNLAYLESLRLDTPRVRPGEVIRARVVLRPYRGEREVVTIGLPVPPETPEGSYTLVVCDASYARRMDLRARPHRLEPRTLDDLFALVAEERDNRHLYARLELPEAGVAVEGRELPRLPRFALDVFRRTRWSGTVTPLRRMLAADVPTRWILVGRLQDRVEVRRRP